MISLIVSNDKKEIHLQALSVLHCNIIDILKPKSRF